LSIGTRQLIALTRIILKNNKIICLDEATSNIDKEFNILIKKLIEKKFKECTIITIEHKINDILDYDKVILLSNGEIIEIGNPIDLIKVNNSKLVSKNLL
jgi:ABC-type multidrug transport system fused ATPase/permease subunit